MSSRAIPGRLVECWSGRAEGERVGQVCHVCDTGEQWEAIYDYGKPSLP